jgi:hypothetical protein
MTTTTKTPTKTPTGLQNGTRSDDNQDLDDPMAGPSGVLLGDRSRRTNHLWMNSLLLLAGVVFVLVLTGSSTRTTRRNTLLYSIGQTESGREEEEPDIMEILEGLHRMGIPSLCHPTSDDYAPRIPRCPSGHNNEVDIQRNNNGQERALEEVVVGLDEATSSSSSSSFTTLTTSSSAAGVIGGKSGEVWFMILNILACVVCIMSVALMSCMFLGFMTLDPLDLRIQIRASVDAGVRARAAALLPIVEQNHRLLVTLLLSEALFYESMPLLMDNLLPSWAAILMSVTVLLVFGEIIPSAFVTGPEQLRWASRLTPLMNFLLWFLHPVAAPLTWMLDTMVPKGEAEDEYYDRGELSALIKIQFEDRQRENKRAGALYGLTPHSRTLRGASPAIGNNISVTVAEKSRGWRNLKREIMEAVEHRRVEQLHQLQQQLHQHKQQSNHPHHHHHHGQQVPSSPGGGSSATSAIGAGPGGGAFHHHPFHSSSNSGGDYGGVGHHRRTGRAMSIGSDTDSVHSYSTPPAYEQIAPPLHQAEMNVLEGALTMKTKVGTVVVVGVILGPLIVPL